MTLKSNSAIILWALKMRIGIEGASNTGKIQENGVVMDHAQIAHAQPKNTDKCTTIIMIMRSKPTSGMTLDCKKIIDSRRFVDSTQ